MSGYDVRFGQIEVELRGRCGDIDCRARFLVDQHGIIANASASYEDPPGCIQHEFVELGAIEVRQDEHDRVVMLAGDAHDHTRVVRWRLQPTFIIGEEVKPTE